MNAVIMDLMFEAADNATTSAMSSLLDECTGRLANVDDCEQTSPAASLPAGMVPEVAWVVFGHFAEREEGHLGTEVSEAVLELRQQLGSVFDIPFPQVVPTQFNRGHSDVRLVFISEAQAVAAYDVLTRCGGPAARVGATILENAVERAKIYVNVPLAEALDANTDLDAYEGTLPAIEDVITLPALLAPAEGSLVREVTG